ncbi:DMT family transporter [Massilia sp. 2TAF26]|uniref:DMT family transporter n=1 Tax=Massilia sp. 2TAF26 TaxID=3233012 RepID=UPI003F97344F
MFRRAPEAAGLGLATAGLTAVAMLAFAANSLLCRFALQQDHIDPAGFGAVRLLAGALVLACVMRAKRQPLGAGGDWRSAALLFAYVALFSFAYVSLAAGTGALILFGTVQLTMLGVGLLRGERFAPAGWLGLVLAMAGLVVLLLPGAAAPSPLGALLMAGAGAAWGGYSLRGKGAADPLAATFASFLRAAPLGLLLALLFAGRLHADARGVWLAIASGAITSGLGYVVWYAALRRLSALRAAVVQLSVPLIATAGGALLLGEAFTLRLGVSALAILGGIALVLGSRAGRGSA